MSIARFRQLGGSLIMIIPLSYADENASALGPCVCPFLTWC